MNIADTPEAAPMREDVTQAQEADLSWIDVCVTGSEGNEIIVGYSPGWNDFGIEPSYLCDNVEDYDAPSEPGLYRWSGYVLGYWGEDDPINIKGGTWTPYRLAHTARPDIGERPPMDGEGADERLKKAYQVQQAGVPDQTALVWRSDLLDMFHRYWNLEGRLTARPDAGDGAARRALLDAAEYLDGYAGGHHMAKSCAAVLRERAEHSAPPTCNDSLQVRDAGDEVERVALLREAASLVGRIEAAGLIDYEHSAFEAWKKTARDLAPRLRAAAMREGVDRGMVEALWASQTLLEAIDRTQSTDMRSVREQIVANRAALSRKGG